MKTISVADLSYSVHATAVLDLLDEYARGIQGGGRPLKEYVRENLIAELSDRPGCCMLLAFVEDQPAGLAICFEGFSTFACKPTLNIHDFVVSEKFRGQGLAKDLLDKVQEVAESRGCCKLTLEVLEGNERARKVYEHYGFVSYELDPKMGRALFLEKPLE